MVSSSTRGASTEGVAVHGSESQELDLLEPGDHAKDAKLLEVPEPRLHAHEVVGRFLRVLGAELQHA